MHQDTSLDRIFHALADGTHRSMINALSKGQEGSAGELGGRFRSAQPTISKHLKVLEEAGLVERRIEGRVHWFRLRQAPLDSAVAWIDRHRALWSGALDQLDTLLSQQGNDDAVREE